MASPRKKLRARDDSDKRARREQILKAAAAAFHVRPYDQITVQDIARRAKLAKGTLYLYFETKEELFLALLTDELEAWLSAIEPRLVPMELPELSELVSASVASRPELVRLICLMHGVLEHNVPVEVAARFKLTLLGLSGRLLRGLVRARPELASPQAISLVVTMFALVVGLGQMSDPSKAVLRALDARPELAPFRVDLSSALKDSLVALMRHAELAHGRECEDHLRGVSR